MKLSCCRVLRVGFGSASKILCLLISLLGAVSLAAQGQSGSAPLFNGRTFQGWEGDTLNTWQIQDSALVGGSLSETVPQNDFLVTTESYNNYELQLKFKLLGDSGFVNAGVQFHSQRLEDPPYEMIGYQADLGDGYWASLYDESRRRQTLTAPDSATVAQLLKPGEWNDYRIRTEDGRIQLWLNGQQTVDYTEPNDSIPQSGRIGLQIHGGGKAKVFYKDLLLEELP